MTFICLDLSYSNNAAFRLVREDNIGKAGRASIHRKMKCSDNLHVSEKSIIVLSN